mmetsp:Transcript_1344/g.3582  ORF Transcript_1344/g.3582 Transcript_1344/m.3582 type:complete len:247 (+) Transcript_1344:992-1732(+)
MTMHYSAHNTPASPLSLSTSSSTLPRMRPPSRLGGASTLSTESLGETSTPRSSGERLSRGFFLAFMMLGSVLYRGSFSRRSVVTTAGVRSPTVSRPPSTSRTTSSLWPPSCTSSCDANVPWGHPSSPASIWPVWLLSPSMLCLPISTRSGSCRATMARSSLARARGSRSASVCTCSPRSAPIAMAVLSVSWHCLGPMDTATTSVASFFSFSLTASSTAISQNGFIDIFTDAVSTPDPSGLTRILAA